MAYFLGVDTGGTYTDAVILDEAADRVIVLHKGRILAEGSPQALVDTTGADSLAAAFLQMTGGTDAAAVTAE